MGGAFGHQFVLGEECFVGDVAHAAGDAEGVGVAEEAFDFADYHGDSVGAELDAVFGVEVVDCFD